MGLAAYPVPETNEVFSLENRCLVQISFLGARPIFRAYVSKIGLLTQNEKSPFAIYFRVFLLFSFRECITMFT